MLTTAEKARFDNTSPWENTDKVIGKKVGVVKGIYSFATDGGAVGAYNLKDEWGDTITLPDNTIITKCYISSPTTPTSVGAPTISIGVNTAVDLLATGTALAAFTDQPIAGIADGTAANMVKLTAARNLVLTVENVAAATLTAGIIHVFCEFVYSA